MDKKVNNLKIALIDPQIPQNTGSIARTCAATESALYVLGNPAFEISDKKARRAGLDYWPYVNLNQYKSWEEYLEKTSSENFWYFSKFGKIDYWDVKYTLNDTLVFGSETKGLGEEFLANVPNNNIVKIPMSSPNVRSLNLSNAVSIGLYEALRQNMSHSQ